jgi:hypothetical protein
MSVFRDLLPAFFLAAFCCLTAIRTNAQTASTGGFWALSLIPPEQRWWAPKWN